jgi:hypothetical protein
LQDVPVHGRLSQALASREWKGIQERFREPDKLILLATE